MRLSLGCKEGSIYCLCCLFHSLIHQAFRSQTFQHPFLWRWPYLTTVDQAVLLELRRTDKLNEVPKSLTKKKKKKSRQAEDRQITSFLLGTNVSCLSRESGIILQTFEKCEGTPSHQNLERFFIHPGGSMTGNQRGQHSWSSCPTHQKQWQAETSKWHEGFEGRFVYIDMQWLKSFPE